MKPADVKKQTTLKSVIEAPGPEGDEVRLCSERYAANQFLESQRLYETYGDVVALRRGPFTTIFLFHGAHAKHVMIDKVKNYSRRTSPAQKLKAALGDGLITANRPEWVRQRRLAQPAFTKRAIDSFLPLFNEEAAELVSNWESAGTPRLLDVHHQVGTSLLTVMGRILFSESFSEVTAEQLRVAVAGLSRLEHVPHLKAVLFNDKQDGSSEYVQRYRAFFAQTEKMNAELDRIILARKNGPRQADILDNLLYAGADTDECFSLLEVRDQLKNLVIAGHDTTMATISFALYELGRRAEIVAKVRDEVSEVVGSAEVSRDHLDRLVYLEALVQETLRLYPAVPHIDRRAEGDDVIDGFRIPKGASVALCPFIVQRRADLWDDPLSFRPERFLDAAKKEHIFPFGLGAHKCLGSRLAIDEVKIFLTHIMRSCEIGTPPHLALELEAQFTAHPKGGSLELMVSSR